MKSLKESILGKQDFDGITDTAKDYQQIRKIFQDFMQKKCPNHGKYDEVVDGVFVLDERDNLMTAKTLLYRDDFGTDFDDFLCTNIKRKSPSEVKSIFRKTLVSLQKSLSKYDAKIKPIICDCDDEIEYAHTLFFNYKQHKYTVDFRLFLEKGLSTSSIINTFSISMDDDLFSVVFPN